MSIAMRKFLSLCLIMASVLMALLAGGSSGLYAKDWTSGQTVIGHSPVATGVTVTGTPQAGSVLSGHYTFSDPDGDDESGSLMQWYASGDGGTTVTPLSGNGASSQNYTLQDADTGKQILFGVTPKTDPAITDPSDGPEVRSALTSVIVHATPDATLSTFTQDRAMIAATGTDEAILTLTLKRGDGNPVTGLASLLSLAHTATDGVDTVSLTTEDKGAGVYNFVVTGTAPGTVQFTPQLDGVPLVTTPANLSVVLTGDSSTAQIAASDLTVTTDNAVADDSATNQVRAVVTDAAGRPVSGVAVSFTTVTPAHITVSTGVTDIHGVATASLASPQAGPVAVTAKINSTGSEQTVTVNFIAGAPVTGDSTLTAGTASIIANNGGTGGTSLLTLTLKDAKGNPVTGLTEVSFVVTGVTDTSLTGVTETPAGSGVYTSTLSGTRAGTATVSTTVGGSAFSATPASVTVTLTPDLSTAAVSTLTGTTNAALANNTDTQTLTATVEDTNGNPVPNATVDWSVTTGIATLNSASSVTDGNGQAVMTVTDTTAETATITAKVGSNAADSGKTADVTFGLYPVVSGITQGVNNSPADNVTANTLIIQVSDLAGNALANTATTLNFAGTDLNTGPATLKNGANALTAANTSYAVTTDANGQVTLTATNVTAESITVSVKTSSSTQAAVTQTSAFEVYPVLNAADISVPLDGAPSDAASLNTVKAIVRDLKGNPVSGQTVNWTMSSPSGLAVFSTGGTTAGSTSDATGAATISLTSRRMENVTVTASVGSAAPEQSQSKATTFMQYVNLTITGLVNNNCTVTCTVTVNVNAKDIDGNPVSGLKVGTHSAAYGGGSSGFTIPSTDSTGNAAVQRPMAVAAVDTGVYAFADSFSNPGIISATRSGVDVSEYRSASTTVTTVNPVSITNITTPANPYTFATGSGFPTTGFNGAYFKVNLSDGNPTAYTWAVDGTDGGTSYTTVDVNGQVTLKAAKSGVQTVQVKDKTTGAVLASYPWRLSGWFTNSGTTNLTWVDATAYCAPPKRLPSLIEILGSDPGSYAGFVSRGPLGGIFSEWGNVSSYPAGFRLNYDYWTYSVESVVGGSRNITTGDPSRGVRFSTLETYQTPTMCVQGL
ncbi:hypothetical protein FWL67_19210 [Salmonella enterica]|nr:hypothetical protein [Salmonella enterica]